MSRKQEAHSFIVALAWVHTLGPVYLYDLAGRSSGWDDVKRQYGAGRGFTEAIAAVGGERAAEALYIRTVSSIIDSAEQKVAPYLNEVLHSKFNSK